MRMRFRFAALCTGLFLGGMLGVPLGGGQAAAESPQAGLDLLIFAPHPDDEALGCAGVLRRALKNGDEVLVVVATCGDAYQSAKRAFEERFTSRAYDRDGALYQHCRLI